MTIYPSTSPIQPVVYAQSLNVCSIAPTTSTSLPSGFQVNVLIGNSVSESYAFTGSGWENESTGLPVTSTDLNGLVTFANPASYDIGITW